MSDEEQEVTETQVLTAEFKDGQLEIVEVTPFDNNETNSEESNILPDMSESSEETEPKYQILDSSKGLLQLDLLNLTLVKCGDGGESYRLVTNQEAADGEIGETVTCVLQSSDGEGEDGQNSYTDKKEVYLTSDEQDQYVMVNGEDGPMVILKSSLEGVVDKGDKLAKKKPVKKLTAVELLERAKALQKAKALLQPTRRGRKRRGTLPPPHELLASPNFKLFLYSCKLCHFKCNAIKELTAHKTAEHGATGARARGGARAACATLQCARCPFRGGTHSQLMKHVQDQHLSETSSNEVYLNSAEAEAADVLVCGACGFESASRPDFKRHIEEKHNISTS